MCFIPIHVIVSTSILMDEIYNVERRQLWFDVEQGKRGRVTVHKQLFFRPCVKELIVLSMSTVINVYQNDEDNQGEMIWH